MTTRHGKPRKDFRTGREKVERYVKVLLRPINQGGLALADGWVPLEQLRYSVKELGNRPVSVKFLRNLIETDPNYALSEDSTKARSLSIDESEGRYATPDEVMYAWTTRQGLEALSKATHFDTVVTPKPSSTAEIILRVYARRAETLGARFYRTKLGPEQLRAENVPLACISTVKDRGV